MSETDGGLDAAKGLMSRGVYPQAEGILAGLLQSQPLNKEARLLLGICLAKMDRLPLANEAFREVLAQDSNSLDALIWLARISTGQEEKVAAFGYAERAVALAPDRPDSHAALGTLHLRSGRISDAVPSFERAVSLAPDVARYHTLLGQAYLALGQPSPGVRELQRAIQLDPKQEEAYRYLAGLYLKFHQGPRALELLATAIRAIPGNASLHLLAASACAMVQNEPAAESHYKRAAELSPTLRLAYADRLAETGRLHEAGRLYAVVLRDEPLNGKALHGLKQSKGPGVVDEAYVANIRAILASPASSRLDRLYAHYSYAEILEERKDFEHAMSHFEAAKALTFDPDSGDRPFDARRLEARTAASIALYQALKKSGVSGLSDPTPIFIVGSIRSGTTLLDQVLSSHPEVASAGELRFWPQASTRMASAEEPPTSDQLLRVAREYIGLLRSFARTEKRVTDKMPLNIKYLGLIATALPAAKIIHIRRHPVDTCLSILRTEMGARLNFATSKANIVSYYQDYQRVARYWQKEISEDRMAEITYESLVEDPETVIQALLEFCGLPWDDACLRHHESKSAIETPSLFQARRPIFRSSVERWKPYEPWLGEFAELL